MRPNLLHPLRERTHERSERRGHERHATQRRSEPRVIVLDVEPSVTAGLADDCDLAAERVRRAGGPLDTAVYTCSCGYVFSAAVSTTVACPHCGTDQAW
jgi:predicted Zn-ribbon and HTH transcriptional regulator